jgi:hypothetical protein
MVQIENDLTAIEAAEVEVIVVTAGSLRAFFVGVAGMPAHNADPTSECGKIFIYYKKFREDASTTGKTPLESVVELRDRAGLKKCLFDVSSR